MPFDIIRFVKELWSYPWFSTSSSSPDADDGNRVFLGTFSFDDVDDEWVDPASNLRIAVTADGPIRVLRFDDVRVDEDDDVDHGSIVENNEGSRAPTKCISASLSGFQISVFLRETQREIFSTYFGSICASLQQRSEQWEPEEGRYSVLVWDVGASIGSVSVQNKISDRDECVVVRSLDETFLSCRAELSRQLSFPRLFVLRDFSVEASPVQVCVEALGLTSLVDAFLGMRPHRNRERNGFGVSPVYITSKANRACATAAALRDIGKAADASPKTFYVRKLRIGTLNLVTTIRTRRPAVQSILSACKHAQRAACRAILGEFRVGDIEGDVIAQRLAEHYAIRSKLQALILILSMDALGNPAGIARCFFRAIEGGCRT